MLPEKLKIGFAIGILLLCSSSAFVTAGDIWHDGPINCYTCNGVEECAQSKGVVRKCEDNNDQTCLTVFNGEGVVSRRGCSDDVHQAYNDYCISNPDHCPACSSSGCNVATSLDQYVECLACDSALDANCVRRPEEAMRTMCLGECMTALYPAPVLVTAPASKATDGDSSPARYHLVRSCLNDRDMDDQALCLSGSDEHCIGCSGANCNVQALPETRHSCYQCDGEDCEDPSPLECVVVREDDQCYYLLNDEADVQKMGCVSDFDNEDAIAALVKEKLLYVCDGPDCNSFENIPTPKTCMHCDSSESEACATKPTSVLTKSNCNNVPYTHCYERIDNATGTTHRGCLADLEEDAFMACLNGSDAHCSTCLGNECNKDIIPSDRTMCYRCDSSTDSTCTARPSTLTVCPTYQEDDACVVVFEAGVTRRGCRSELDCDASDASSCRVCQGDGCNTHNLQKLENEMYGIFQDLPLNCNTCSGVEECASGMRNPRKCEGDPFQDCLTVFDAEGRVVRRGCEDAVETEYLEHCESNPELCFNCKSNGCNTVADANVATQQCVYCDAAANPECLFNPEAITQRRRCVEGCVASLYTRKSDAAVQDLVRTCVEDIEPDDRADCTAANNCVQCAEDGCNAMTLPEVRLSCYHCSGDNCDEPVPQQCLGYAFDDQCYIRFENVTNSAIAMGCRSEFTAAQIEQNIKQIFLCDGDNCNTYETLPPARLCYVCDSATDVNCAVDPASISSKSRCQINPFTECYTRIRDDGHTERGCLYSLPEQQFRDCQDAVDPLCRICSETDCNQAVFPSTRQRCYRCSSDDDAACESAPSTSQACPLFQSPDTCVTKILDGVTRRGCGSEFDCADSDRKSCRSCSSNNCNSVDLIAESIGEPGMFQPLPLRCYHCNATTGCSSESMGVASKCEGDDTQTCTVAFDAAGAVVARGCSNSVDAECSASGNVCYDCKSNECNVATSAADYVDCVFCNAQLSDACTFDVASVTRTRRCHQGCMTTLYPRTDDAHPVYELLRSCLDDLEAADRAACTAGSDAHCAACTSDMCNTGDLAVARKSCYHCEGENCDDPKVQTCRAVMDDDQCFVRYDERVSVTQMGCKSDFDPAEVTSLLANKRLWLCDDDNCNTFDNLPEAQRCVICNSRTDKNCAVSPGDVSSDTNCAVMPFTQCYTRILSSGHTERGCLSSLEDDEFLGCLQGSNATQCQTCVDSGCNNQLHPAERRSCHVCTSDQDPNCETSPQSSELCLIYAADMQCVSTLTADGTTVRGCSSDVSCTDAVKCAVCDEDNCNSANINRQSDGRPGMWQELPLSCHTCDGAADCAANTRLEVCANHEYCMTVFGTGADDEVLARGCSDSVEASHGSYCNENADSCHNCNSNECNAARSQADYIDCVYCDAATNGDCTFAPTAVSTRRKCHKACMTALYRRSATSAVHDLIRTCLDDKDAVDQNECATGGDAKCRSCTSAGCNVDQLPEQRLSCWSCVGSDCESPEAGVCQSYREDEACFMEFDSASDIVRMGCVSDLADAYFSSNQHMMVLCNATDNCNSFDMIPATYLCATCNSNTDPTCASDPASIATVEQCATLPNTQCYTRVNSDGSTERGCVGQLSKTQMQTCLNGDGSSCTTCEGDRCNVDVFPAGRRSCQRCNSKDDPSCLREPDAASFCPIYSQSEFCTAKLVNGHVYRGCSSEFQCDDSDKYYCRQCHTDNCNVADFVGINIGYPGDWQGVPINCRVCEGAEECAQGSSAHKCEGNELQTCGVVFATNGSVVQRGCSDQIYTGANAQHCDDNTALCKFCKSNGCNDATSLADYVDCTYCDSREDEHCITDVAAVEARRSCHGQCMTALRPRSDDVNTVYDLLRGCLDDKDLDDRQTCGENEAYCQACSGTNCNTAALPENRLHCFQCAGGSSCDETAESKACLGYRENDQCYTAFSMMGAVHHRGCVSDLSDSFIESHKRRIVYCDGDNCNSLDTEMPKLTACNICNSLTDPNCATNPSGPIVAAVCETLPYTSCYTHVDDAGVTHRGCLSDTSDDLFFNCISGSSTDCVICDENNCNNEVFPANRRSCSQCHSQTDANCASQPLEYASVCPLYVEDDSCMTAIDDSGFVLRGCSSQFMCDTSNRDECRVCGGADNCNTHDLLAGYIGEPGDWQGLPLNCYVCEGEENCAQGSTVHKCEGNDLQTCATVFSSAGAVISRGCSDTVMEQHGDYCDQNSDNCKRCKSNGCNNGKSLDDYVDCYFCDSRVDERCITDVNAIEGRRSCHGQCMTALRPRSEETNTVYDLLRGCLDDKDLDDREACAAGENGAYCKACSGKECNSDEMPENRLHCFQCPGGSTCDATSESKACLGYRENDQCYMVFSMRGAVHHRGCVSDLSDSFIEMVKRRIVYCDGDNCNSLDTEMPTPTACNICNSLTDPNCATNPSEPIVAAACETLPYTSCYTHVDDAGVTHRGCLSDTSDDLFFNCISGSSTDCVVCDENNCNNEVFPANRRSCSRCHSQSDPDCESRPLDYASICPLYVDNDSCMTAIDDSGFVLRGCSSQFTCDTSNRDECRVCEGADNCNTHDLLDGYIGEPGLWQGLPLNCYVCEGEENCAQGSTVHKCENNNMQTCATVFNDAGAVISRGCSDTVMQQHADYCDENSGNCQRCKSNGCNNAKSLDDYVDCYFCDSAKNGAACSVELATSTRTRRCHGGCMVALYPRTSANDTAYEMSRSCLDDMDLDEREACAAGEMPMCASCTGERCNVMDLPEERHECFHCADADCEDVESRKCSAYHPQDQCFILYDEESSIVDMGCRSAFEADAAEELVKQKRLLICDEKNCNALATAPTPKMCSVCDSVSDPRCATNPNLVANMERCAALPYTECYTRVTADQRTTRGCLAALDEDAFHGCLTGSDPLCEICTGDKCNELAVYPADRLRCHQCSSSDDSACTDAPSSNYPCPVYDANDACVTSWWGGVTVRGCASSTACHDPSDRRNCRTCTTSGCNDVNLELVPDEGEPGRWQDVPLTCHTCVGAEECAASLGVYRVCEDNLYQGCMTVFDDEGRVVQRGCADAVEAANAAICNAQSDHCPRCNSNGCNTATSLDDYVECVFCDSDANGDCVRQPGAITATRRCHKHCMTALFERAAEENPAYGLARSCLDDMDLDDREACAAGDNAHCVACSGASCNSVALPETRLSCNTCAGDDCQLPTPLTCSTYRPDDKCYIRYDERRQVVAMGCRSEFTNAAADYMVMQKRLLLCDGDNCNTLESQPASQTCVLCSSRTDANCATDPASVSSTTPCAQVPYTECYTRVVADGATERGCLASLYDDEFVGCLNGTSATCVACTGASCNKDLFPGDRASCHICDSDSDPACEAQPDSLALCPLYVAGDVCVTAYNGGRTVRGCGSSVSCEASGARNCRTCVGDGCNTVNLAAAQDNNFGKWQDLPLRCWTCSGDDCSDESVADESLTCENNNEQDCMTVFDAEERVVRRGCSDAVETEYEQHCAQNPDHCFACKSNECNVAVSRSEFVDCVYCDSFNDLECLWNPTNASLGTRKCRGSCMTALYESDGGSDPGYDLIRTCLDDKESTAQFSCRNGLTKLCHACTGDSCNVDDLPADRRQCHHCDGADCEQPTALPCPLYRENDSCYAWFDETNSVNKMGCLSSFRNQAVEDLLRTKRIYVCDDEDNCNAMDRLPVAQRCAVCDSAEDPLCATNAFEIGTIDECNMLPYTSCYSRIHSDGTTSRGCLSELPADDFIGCLQGHDEKCGLCTGDGCNREIFPEDRLQCHTCTSEDDPNCEAFPNALTVCPIISDTASCKSALSGNLTVRGCGTDIFCDATDKTTCRSCQATGCNTISLIDLAADDGYHGAWQELPLRCHHCEGEHCLASLGPAYTCAVDGDVPQDCMTVFGETGEVRRRGCSHDVEDYEDLFCRQHPGHCQVCKSNECNSAWSLDDYVDCVFCNSTQNADCALNPTGGNFATRRCHKECMVTVGHSAEEIIRSCLDDKEVQVRHVCRSNESGQECASCDSSHCNTFGFPADRLKCHVCADASCSSSSVQFCPNYAQDDYCFAKYNDVGRVELLGCASSQNASDIDAWTAAKKLVRCDGSECNDLGSLPTSGVCVACDSSVNPACAQDPASVTTTDDCYAPHNHCLTRINAGGDTVRGCANVLSDDETTACSNNGTCATCEGDHCNKEVFPVNRRKCYICNSVADSLCEAAPEQNAASFGLICPTYVADDRCVTRRVDGVIERGCASDMTCDESDSDNCKICSADNCNSKDMSGGASGRFATGSLSLALLLAIVSIGVGLRH